MFSKLLIYKTLFLRRYVRGGLGWLAMIVVANFSSRDILEISVSLEIDSASKPREKWWLLGRRSFCFLLGLEA